MHQHHVGVGCGQPGNQLVSAGHIGSEDATVTFVITIMSNTTALRPLGTHKIDIGVSRIDQAVPQVGAPTTGAASNGIPEGHNAHLGMAKT